ncbi:lipid A export permease/ATP-binding protein MsbA [Ectothiorhodospira shaposhnikovii]|uniref:lipid A export permease/ATP-binding protein MsbA n=1 Tax=Ectothiorhodospira shaposhnikovii TaxID=1054 RepID=UPI001902E373|nr:lipid A export permease/ATP-binding protein MsbA [Ectothiorhodospira shaposhnikovii]MBK1672237.1 lipid A export permease/ATP-binding protein MsbA [Ectothiorhodospira shaposhnikovii]
MSRASLPGPPQYQIPGVEVYRRLLSHSLKYWPYLLVALVTMLITAATETGFAALMRPLMDGSFVDRDPDAIRWIPLAIIGIFFIRGVAEFLSNYTMKWVGRQVVKELRGRMFRHLLQMPVSYFDRNAGGQLISRLTYNVEQVAAASTDSITILIRDTVTVLGLLGWMLYLNWKLTLAVLIVAPAVAFAVDRVTRRFRKISRRIQASMGDVTHVAGEVMDGNRVVKIFGGEHYEQSRFDEINERNRRLHMKMVATQASNLPIIQFFVAIALALIVWIATHESLLQDVSVGTFVSFITAMLLLLTPIRRLVNVNAMLQKGIAAGQNIFGLLDEPLEQDQGTRSLDRSRGEIRLRDVSFSYDAAKGEVLRQIDLDVAPGETVALVGRSGSGKTTLVNLLPRFYEPQRGEVLLDGVDIRQYRLADLRRQIAYVGQHVTLFNDTIANNIAYGSQVDPSDERRILEAAEAAQAMEFIRRLPEGLNTLVGDNGVLLSGGQRQRLAIARALLKDAPILILDEATSALDTEAERHIQKALELLLQNRTTLVIAHRLSTVEKADRIVVMQEGCILETGTHRDLLARGGMYAHLHRLQFNDDGMDQA